MFILALTLALSNSTGVETATVDTKPVQSNNPIHQLRQSEIAERLAQSEAKRLQLELQIAKAKHAINGLKTTVKTPSLVAEELKDYQLLGIVSSGDSREILLRLGQQIIRLQDGVAGPMQLTASLENNWVRLQRFGRFRDLPIVQGH